uniref:Ciliary microtubule inner protein 5 n=1 Tax=Latimeria chalumnae TaxID=7897 RepID=M3XHD2_LATCH|nr:PREDICTED: uncharacterized protein C2orf50 homolog isoform X2 [Latimeria chalumnae]|eukprot:XP_005995988.1 PREDICTED: uncharacterized protein C2orf50 homolog isoform X2 [Latimeria chalumnae]
MALQYSYFNKANYGSQDLSRKQAERSSRVSPGKTLQAATECNGWDAVKQDQVWREFVHAEWRGVKQWQKNWSFLKNYDALGRPKVQEPLPVYVPVFSDKIPNTMNQTFGSRMNTEIGQTLMKLDHILISGNQKRKLESELLPS